MARVQLGEQIGGARLTRERDHRGTRGYDLFDRSRHSALLTVRDRVGDRAHLPEPRVAIAGIEVAQRGLRARHEARRERGLQRRELVAPARVAGLARLDGEHEACGRAVALVRPARQHEPGVAEARPRGAVGRTGRERGTAEELRRGIARHLDLARAGGDLVPAQVAVAAQLVGRADADDRALARRPRHQRPTAPGRDERGGGCDRRGERDRLEPHDSSFGVATNSVHAPNVSGATSATVSPAPRMISANSSGGGNAATDVWR